MIESVSLGQTAQVKINQLRQTQATPAEVTENFGQMLQTAINNVDAQEKNVHKLNDQFLIGQVDVTKVLVAAEQAHLSLQFTSQVRNKVVEAYQEIMRMQL